LAVGEKVKDQGVKEINQTHFNLRLFAFDIVWSQCTFG